MSHAIFRVQGIKTTSDLRGIGKHNLDRVSLTNDDIDSSRSSENIHLIESESYLKKFFTRVEPMKQEHDEKMKTERKDRVKSFEGKINSAKNDIACEFLFTSDTKFFEGKSKEDIQAWGQQSLDFVEKEIGIDKKNILHAVIHMDESTPHLHIVAVPLVNKYDGRSKKDVWQLNRKNFIKTKEDMSNLQDKYFEHMKNAGHELERGQKGSERHHLSVEEFKVQSVKKELEALQDNRETLKGDVDGLLADVKGLKKAVIHARDVNVLDAIKPSIVDRKHVRIPVQDFEDLKLMVKATEAFKQESLDNLTTAYEQENKAWELTKKNEVLQQEKAELKKENSELKADNETLKEQVVGLVKMNNYLTRVLDKIKVHSSQQLGTTLEKIQEFVGKVRMLALNQEYGEEVMNEKGIDRLIPTDEKKGAKAYLQFFYDKKTAKEKLQQEVEKENEVVKMDKEPEKVEAEESSPEKSRITRKINNDFEMDR